MVRPAVCWSEIYGGKLMKALQRLVVTGHWAAFLWGLAGIYALFNWLAIIGKDFDENVLEILFAFYSPIVAFAFVPWIFTGKFILWPWNRPLPRQEG